MNRLRATIPFASALIASTLHLAGCQGPLVGGQCLDGFAEDNGACVASEPGGTDDGDGSSDGDGSGGRDGDGDGDADGGGGGGRRPPGSGGASPAATGSGGDDASSGSGGGKECDAGASLCGDGCVDLTSDPFSCGACDVVCPSGICVDGRCEGAYAGHVVVCGFGPDTLGATAPARLVGNAVFAWPADPVRIGAWHIDRGAGPAPLVSFVASESDGRGREASIEWFDDADALRDRLVAGTLDVALVGELPLEQADAADLGARLAPGFDALTARGGVFVMLASDAEGVVDAFGASSGLADALGARAAASGPLDVVAFDDLLAVGVPTPFARPSSSRSFLAPSFGGRVVVTDAAGTAVVLHGVRQPPGDD